MHDGIYLVVWPDQKYWSDKQDRRRRAVAVLDRQGVVDVLAAQARTLAQEGFRVRTVHLDVSYGRRGTSGDVDD